MMSKYTVDALHDLLATKYRSTVEYAFLVLKNMGEIRGDYVQAESAGRVDKRAKLVEKDNHIGRHNRILRIMTNKRRWYF